MTQLRAYCLATFAIFGLFLASSFFHHSQTHAHEGATGVVKERMDMMKRVRDHLKAISAIVKGEQPFNKDALKHHSERLSFYGEAMLPLFPEGSLSSISEAKPNIWANWAQYEKEAHGLRDAGKAFNQAIDSAQSPRDLAPFIQDIGFTCSSCHKQFRAKK